MRRLDCLLAVLFALLAVKGAASVTLFKVEVPDFKRVGESATLLCNYSLADGEGLYSVKWYKDNEEFYRYVPRSRPAMHSYKVEGVEVQRHFSNNYNVHLQSLNLRSSGLYRCEVSAEAPSFSSVNGEGRMEVVYLPKHDPLMDGGGVVYAMGDLVSINCTSSKSFPPAEMRWYINNHPVSGDNVIHFEPVVHKHGLVTIRTGLRFEAMEHHFVNGRMTVKCTSNVSLRKPENPFQQNVPSLDSKWVMMDFLGGASGVSASPALLLASLLLLLHLLFSHRVQ
ncbi:uncharacterized protein LOC132194745 [Neocloeon triangulifer]|uniref:uncharacterized protein LOC132194745 n=1 Tax=Neocloeon triangulifer TaxID=2078957 RepID=UPI00286ED8D9|nr:uncharacterized protein LOC132194745 [Neocloeon triangulifer]